MTPPTSAAPDGAETFELEDAVIANLARADVAATLEWPGCVVIELGSTEQLWTGQHGFHYGTVYVLRDGVWDTCRCDQGRHHDPCNWGVPEDCQDPVLIARALARFVNERRAQSA